MHLMKAAAVVAGAVTALIVGARLADVRPPVPSGPPSLPAPPVPQPAAPVPRSGEDAPSLREGGPRSPSPALPADAPPRTISGVVLDEEGNPVAGALVIGPYMKRRAHGTCYPGLSFDARTDDQGRFEGALPRLPAVEERGGILEAVLDVGFLPEPGPTPPDAWESLEAGRSVTGLRIVLRRGAEVVGTVLDGDGRAVEGAVVEFLLPFGDGEARAFEQATTDGGGTFGHSMLDPREPWVVRTEFLGVASSPIPLAGMLDPARPLEVEILLPDLHRAAVAVRDAGATEGTLLYLDGVCEGEGEKREEGRGWEVGTTVGVHVVELWNGGDLRMRETVEPARPGERILVEVDAGGAVTSGVVALARRGCRFPGGGPPY